MQVRFNLAGLIVLVGDEWCLHLFVKRRFWWWGWDVPNTCTPRTFGCGPLFLFVADW